MVGASKFTQYFLPSSSPHSENSSHQRFYKRDNLPENSRYQISGEAIYRTSSEQSTQDTFITQGELKKANLPCSKITSANPTSSQTAPSYRDAHTQAVPAPPAWPAATGSNDGQPAFLAQKVRQCQGTYYSICHQSEEIRRLKAELKRVTEERDIAGEYIEHYNDARLHSATGYITPADRLTGRHEEIFKERDRKLEEARELRRKKRQEASDQLSSSILAGVPLTQTA